MKLLCLVVLAICSCCVVGKPSANENAEAKPLIINNSGSNNNNNDVKNGDDDVDGNLVNGNDNGDNKLSGNVGHRSLRPFIINNSGNNNSQNAVSNGDDNVDGNLVNGNGNGNNSGSGNVASFIINNSGNDNKNNSVQNGNDDANGNLVNGNGNGDNSNSGNVAKTEKSPGSNSASRSDRDLEYLLNEIDNLLDVILNQLGKIDKIPNDSDNGGVLLRTLSQVAETLQNVLRDLRVRPNGLLNSKLQFLVTKVLARTDVAITSIVGKLELPLGELLASLRGLLRPGNNEQLGLVPALLQKVIQLLALLL